MTMNERQMMHPLQREDPIAYKFIQFVRLGYLEDEAPVPIPRHQGLPEDAFGKLTGRSILVSLSHGWFFQNHPDPRGRKLDLIRKVFAPRLRERYPCTSIVMFFDFITTVPVPVTVGLSGFSSTACWLATRLSAHRIPAAAGEKRRRMSS